MDMSGRFSRDEDLPPACVAGNMPLCQQQLMRQYQETFGMSTQQQQLLMQQWMGGGIGGGAMQPGMMVPGVLHSDQAPVGQPGMMPQPSTSRSVPVQMTPTEEEAFNQRIQQLEREYRKTPP
jgi:hypothetical protein